MTTIADYKEALNEAQSVILNQELEINLLREKVRLLQHRHFGKSSEQVLDGDQVVLLETELSQKPREEQDFLEEIEVRAHTKKKPGRRPLPDSLPREEVLLDLPEEQKTCETHGVPLEKIGEERSESVEHIPETFKVIVTVRPKYLCPCCEEKKVQIIPAPIRLIPKSFATPNLLAHITLSKFLDHLPLYRQEDIFFRMGLSLSRSTMAEWIIKLGEALIPITNLLQEKLLEGEYLSCDETPIRVLTDDGKRVKSLHYFWARSRPPDFGKPIYLFEYASSRRTAIARELLEGFKGHLQVDQYVAYDFTEKTMHIIRVGCWAHVRRKWFEAQKAMTHKASIPGKMLALIKKLYKLDEDIQKLPETIRTQERKKAAEPILTEIKNHIVDSRRRVPPQSATGKAISYTLNAWDSLIRIFDDYRIRLDNNHTENAIRPIAVGRKNYLFCQTAEGAEAAARIYSLIATAKANGLDLREYLIRLIEHLPKATTIDDYEALLPLN